MLRTYRIENARVNAVSDGDSPILVYINPDGEERAAITGAFDIDEHTLSSAMDPDEVARVEFDPEYIFLIWKRATNYSGQDDFLFTVASVGLFLFREKLVIILPDDIPLTGGGARHAIKTHTLFDVVLGFLYETVHHYLEHLKIIKMVSRELQKRINTSMENEHLIQMFNLSESLVYYLNAVNANNVALVKLRNYAEKHGYPEETIELLDDIVIENTQCFKQAEIYSTIFSGLMDARGTLVNNNMNVLLKKLTIINVVFLPLNLLASIGGMSEFSLMTRGVDWRVSYTLFLVAMVLIGWLTAYVLGKLNFTGATARSSHRRKVRSVWLRRALPRRRLRKPA